MDLSLVTSKSLAAIVTGESPCLLFSVEDNDHNRILWSLGFVPLLGGISGKGVDVGIQCLPTVYGK